MGTVILGWMSDLGVGSLGKQHYGSKVSVQIIIIMICIGIWRVWGEVSEFVSQCGKLWETITLQRKTVSHVYIKG